MPTFIRYSMLASLAALGASLSASADESFADLSLEDLLTLEVTSVAKKPQAPEQAATALTVITKEDIRNSGVSTLPDALRLAPGVEVAEIDGSMTAVTIRGFNWRFSNKLLVLIDGRAVYAPTLAGIFWDQQQVPVESIQRIEVIRGPGATMYGANAVNGVINIVTEHAADSLNGEATLESDLDRRQRAYLRYGMRIGDAGAGRIYANYRKTPSLVDESGRHFNDGNEALQAGFRVDLDASYKDALTVQGDVFSNKNIATTSFFDLPGVPFEAGEQSFEPEGYNLLARWVRSNSTDNAFTLQAYVDQSDRNEFDSFINILTYDVDFSHHFRPMERLGLVWGLNYRRIEDCIEGNGDVTFTPSHEESEWTSGFVQAELAAIPDKLNVTVGTKLENNSFSGFAVQPSARFIWLGDADWSVWGAVSSAVRTPSRLERAINVPVAEFAPLSVYNPGPLPASLVFRGDSEFDVETLTAFELGFRKNWGTDTKLDIAAYRHEYEDLMTVDIGNPQLNFAPIGPGGAPVPVSVLQELVIANGRGGEISGIEAELDFKVMDGWNISLFGDYRDIDLPSSEIEIEEIAGIASLGDSPSWQASIRSDFELSEKFDASIWIRHVSELEFQSAPAYTDLDIRATWRVSDKLELSLIGENLANDRRLEIDDAIYPAPTGYTERRVLLRAGFRF